MHLKKGGREGGWGEGHGKGKEKKLRRCWHEVDLSGSRPFVAVVHHCTREMSQTMCRRGSAVREAFPRQVSGHCTHLAAPSLNQSCSSPWQGRGGNFNQLLLHLCPPPQDLAGAEGGV